MFKRIFLCENSHSWISFSVSMSVCPSFCVPLCISKDLLQFLQHQAVVFSFHYTLIRDSWIIHTNILIIENNCKNLRLWQPNTYCYLDLNTKKQFNFFLTSDYWAELKSLTDCLPILKVKFSHVVFIMDQSYSRIFSIVPPLS